MSYLDLDTIHTPASGGTATYGWGTQIRENFEALVDPPLAIAERPLASAAQYGSGSFHFLDLSTELADTDAMWSALNSERFAVNTSGVYRVTAQAVWEADATGRRELRLGHSTLGILSRAIDEGASSLAECGLQAHWEGTTTGGYFYFEHYQNSGGSLGVSGWMSSRRVARI